MKNSFWIACGAGGCCFLAAIVYVGLFVFPVSMPWAAEQLPEKAPPKSVRPIPTAAVKAVKVKEFRQFPGNVRANRRVELKFSVEGRLQELDAQEGRSVRKGEVLARLDQRDFLNQRDAAKSKSVQAAHELERFSRLKEQNVITLADFEEVKTAADVAQAELGIKEKALEDTVLYAPFDGVVVKRHVERFEHVKAEQEIISLQDISRIEVVIQVSERVIARAGAAGLELLQVRFDADPHQERWFNARVREYGLESDSATRTYDVVVALPPPPDLQVFPGMTATVRAQLRQPLQTASGCSAVRVPVESLWSGTGGDSFVWVINPEGGAPRKKQVRIAALSENDALICNGPAPGEKVAVAGLRTLYEGQPVRPMRKGKEGLDG